MLTVPHGTPARSAKSARPARGVTLIELMVTLSIVVVALLIGMPQVGVISANNRVRTLAESCVAGLQQARTEAIQRGRAVTFQQGSGLDPTQTPFALTATSDATGGDWAVVDSQGAALIRASSGAEGSAGAAVSVSSSTASLFRGQIRFDSFGQALGASADGSFAALASTVLLTFAPSSSTVDCTAPAGGYRCQRITVSPFGQIRLCDPAAVTGDTRAC